jgi:hypothetical protein
VDALTARPPTRGANLRPCCEPQRTKDEMAVIRHLIEQANKTALDIKKDKMLVKREMDELAKQQAKLASRLTDDERAIMDMAQVSGPGLHLLKKEDEQ